MGYAPKPPHGQHLIVSGKHAIRYINAAVSVISQKVMFDTWDGIAYFYMEYPRVLQAKGLGYR